MNLTAKAALCLLLLLHIGSASSSASPAAPLLFKRSARPLSAALVGQNKSSDKKILLTPVKINKRALKQGFRVDLGASTFVAQANPRGFRGARRIYRKSGTSAHSTLATVSTGSLQRAGAPRQEDVHYGEYLLVATQDLKSEEVALGGSLRTPDGRHFSLAGVIKRNRQRVVLREFLVPPETGAFTCASKGESLDPELHRASQLPSSPVTVSTLPVVKVLVAYTRETLQQMGSEALIQSLADFEMTRLIQAAVDSQLNFTFEAAGAVYFIDEPRVGTTQGATLAAMMTKGEAAGYGEALYDVITARGADVVHLIDSYAASDSSGLAFAPTSFDPLLVGCRAFSIGRPNINFTTEARIFQHEIGHLFGAQHNVEDAPAPEQLLHPDAYGHRFTGLNGVGYSTLVAYPTTNYDYLYTGFSNPNVTYQGTPTGITGQRDNVRLMNVTGPLWANFSNYNFFQVTGSFSWTLARGPEDTGFHLRIRFTGNPSQAGVGCQKITLYSVLQDSFSDTAQYSFTTSEIDHSLAAGGTYFIGFWPYISAARTGNFTVPPNSSLKATLVQSGSLVQGQVLDDSNNAVRISGQWLRLRRLTNPNPATYEHVGFLDVDGEGRFSFSPSQTGYYQVAIITGSEQVPISALASTYFVAPTPTSAAPTISPTLPATPVSATPVPSHTLALSAKYLSSRKVSLTGKVQGAGPTGVPLTLSCNGKSRGTKSSNAKGVSLFTLTLPAKGKISCHVTDPHGHASRTLKLGARRR